MALITKAIRGTQDVLPKGSYQWHVMEDVMRRVCAAHGFREIRTPVFEHTELFQRSVGETTDVVQKEMYTFEDKGGRSITLRPEGTAGAVRAMLEHGIYNEGLPIKAYYFTSCYRYEKPQAGRLREFHQFGVEVFGAPAPAADAEIISLAKSVFDCLGVQNLSLELNSIGCPNCRPNYHKALKEYFASHKEELCPTCQDLLDRNPIRILDCKSPICSKIAQGAPVMLDYLCDECNSHFDSVKKHLDVLGITYTVNPKIVRGLDYYTRTVFEFVSGDIGAQSTVCGGGRYDGLVKMMGGPDMPSLGFGLGLERLLLTLQKQDGSFMQVKDATCDLYIVGLGEEAQLAAFRLVRDVRDGSLCAECDLSGRSLKAQMKYADKLGAKFTMVLGEDELKSGVAKIKNMQTGEQQEIGVGADFFQNFAQLYTQSMHQDGLSL